MISEDIRYSMLNLLNELNKNIMRASGSNLNLLSHTSHTFLICKTFVLELFYNPLIHTRSIVWTRMYAAYKHLSCKCDLDL